MALGYAGAVVPWALGLAFLVQLEVRTEPLLYGL